MHETAERAVNAARRLGDAALTAAALARLALAESMMGAAERADAHRSEAAALVESLSDDELARQPRRRCAGSPAWSSISIGTPTATPTPTAHWPWRAPPVRGSSSSSWSRSWAGSGASAASWPRRPSCSTAGSRRRACWATRTRWCGACPAAPPPRSGCGDVELALAAAQESVDLSQDLERGLPLGRGSRRPRRCASRDRATGTRGRAAARLRRRRGAGAHRREPKGALPRGARALLARAGPPRRGKTCRRVR